MASVTAPTKVGPDARTTEPRRRRNYARLIEQTWIWSVVGYSLLRFVVAWGAFGKHGANAWIFGLIDVGTAWPYAKSVATVCKRVADGAWSRLPVPLTAAVVMFFAPYAYLWFSAGTMPSGMRLGMIICVSVLFVAATVGVFAKSRKLRREVDEPVVDLRDAPAAANLTLGIDADAEIVIDLTGDEATVRRVEQVRHRASTTR